MVKMMIIRYTFIKPSENALVHEFRKMLDKASIKYTIISDSCTTTIQLSAMNREIELHEINNFIKVYGL